MSGPIDPIEEGRTNTLQVAVLVEYVYIISQSQKNV